MKTLVLSLSLVAFIATSSSIIRADSFDSDEATIQKKGESSAKVTLDKKTYVVPVSFADGATWDAVKDHYELSDASVKSVKSGHAKLSVGSDGTVSWKS